MEAADPGVTFTRRRTPPLPPLPPRVRPDAAEQKRIKKQTIEAVLEQCQRALSALEDAEHDPNPRAVEPGKVKDPASASPKDPRHASDREADEMYKLIKSKVDSPTFLEKFGSTHMPVSHDISDITASWDMVSSSDLWEDKHADENDRKDQDDYVFVSQDDIVDGIACFMAAYLLSLKQTKDLSPNKLQKALSKTFSMKTKKNKLHKAWNVSKVTYNVASWGATAVGLYQNPVVIKTASVALWTSCRAISKFL